MADDDPLTLAQRRGGAQKIVAEQKRRIAGLRAAKAPTFDAVQALSAFESNLRLFTEHIATPCYRLEGVGNRPRGAEEAPTVQAGNRPADDAGHSGGFADRFLRHRHP